MSAGHQPVAGGEAPSLPTTGSGVKPPPQVRQVQPYEVPDEELLERAVRSARCKHKAPRWVAVMETFCVGSTYSWLLCRRFGVDPDEMVKR